MGALKDGCALPYRLQPLKGQNQTRLARGYTMSELARYNPSKVKTKRGCDFDRDVVTTPLRLKQNLFCLFATQEQ